MLTAGETELLIRRLEREAVESRIMADLGLLDQLGRSPLRLMQERRCDAFVLFWLLLRSLLVGTLERADVKVAELDLGIARVDRQEVLASLRALSYWTVSRRTSSPATS